MKPPRQVGTAGGGCLLQGRPQFPCRGATSAWVEHAEFTGGIKRTALVRFWVLPGPRRRGYHLTCHRSHRQAPPQGGAAGGQGIQHRPGGAVGEKLQRRDRGGYGERRDGGHVRVLTPTPQILGTVQEDMDHSPERERGTVPDGLTSGNRPASVSERLHMGSLAQLGPLHGPWVYLRRHPMGAPPPPSLIKATL